MSTTETPYENINITIDVPQPDPVVIKKIRKTKFELPEPESAKDPKNFYVSIAVLIFSILLMVVALIIFVIGIVAFATQNGALKKISDATPYIPACWIIVSVFMFITGVAGIISAILYRIPKPRLVTSSAYILLSITSLLSCFGGFFLIPVLSHYIDQNSTTSMIQTWGSAGISLLLSLICCIGYAVCGGFEFYFSFNEFLEMKEIQERYKDKIVRKKVIYVSSV